MIKIIFLIFGTIIALVLLVTVYIHIQVNRPYVEIIKLNWSIELPKSYKKIYSADSGVSFQGDGKRYNVFEYKNKDDINVSLDWEDNKNEYIELEIMNVLKDLKILNENIPDFRSGYKYFFKTKNDNSKIYLIFVINSKKLYVIEDIY